MNCLRKPHGIQHLRLKIMMIDIVDSWYSIFNNRHFKIDVYGKRQTALKPLATFLILQLYYNSFYTSFEIC